MTEIQFMKDFINIFQEIQFMKDFINIFPITNVFFFFELNILFFLIINILINFISSEIKSKLRYHMNKMK